MSRNRMYTMAATAMSTVSMSIVGAYMTMLQPKYVVAALVLNMFSTFIVLSLINPYRVEQSEEKPADVQSARRSKASSKCWANTFWQALK